MLIECQYMSNICQTQMKGKLNNETNKVSRARRFKDFEDSSKASKTLQWLHEGFPLTITEYFNRSLYPEFAPSQQFPENFSDSGLVTSQGESFLGNESIMVC